LVDSDDRGRCRRKPEGPATVGSCVAINRSPLLAHVFNMWDLITALTEMLLNSSKKLTTRTSAALVAALLAIGAPPVAAVPGTSGRARASKALNANERANLHLVRASGSTLYEEGQASGTLSGRVRAQLHVGAAFTGTLVVYTREGEVKARGQAQPRSGRYPWESFTGTATITGGTHRYVHAHSSGTFSGAFNRKTYAVMLQTRGRLYF
jgi:hypothetical protein